MLCRKKWFDAGSKEMVDAWFNFGSKVQIVQCLVEGMIQCWVKKYGSMLGRRKWFDAGSKGMVLCWIEGDGSMLGPRIGSFVGIQTGNWMPKTNLAGKKGRTP